MQRGVSFCPPSAKLLNGVFACLFGFGAGACQTATTGAGTDNPKNAVILHAATTRPSLVDPAPSGGDEGAGASSFATPQPSETSSQVQPTSNAAAAVVQVPLRLHELTIESEALGPIPVLVRVPAHASNAQLPVLFMLHGRGEAVKGPTRGVRAFLDDYGLERVWSWLSSNTHAPLPDGSITDGYRDVVVKRLAQQPFRGMIVVMPYLPDRFRAAEAFAQATPYADVLRQTARRLRESFPVSPEVARWGLDGISLGGRVALACGPALSDVFGAIGGVQAAIDEREFTTLLAPMLAQKRQSAQRYSLATSEQDYYRSVLEAFHDRLTQDHLAHSFTVLPGDHSYAFNRGPGLAYLLLTYDALLNPDMLTPQLTPAAHISIVVPTYKEVENIPHLVARIEQLRAAIPNPIDVWFMDDNSKDGSAELVAGMGKDWVQLVTRTADRGLSPAVLEGLRRASGDVLVVMDADLSHPVETIPKMLDELTAGADFVLGSVYVGRHDGRRLGPVSLAQLQGRHLVGPAASCGRRPDEWVFHATASHLRTGQ